MKKLFTNSHRIASGVLFLIAFTLVVINYRPGAILSGWDNLHPEFNCQTNIKRAFFSGWQEYQGLGLPAGHGHASELPREIILCSLGIIFPQADLRYIFFSISLYLGSLGIYFLTYFLFRSRLSSFFGSLFYLLHIATVQLLFAPYEAFMVYYALLPWMVVSIFYYLRYPTKKRLLFLFLIHSIGSSQFYIPTLFLVYGIVLGIILIYHFINTRALRTIINSILAISIANLYWLGLFAYYILTNIGSQKGAHVNFLYSEDVFLKNVEFGNLHDLILLKGFMFKFTGLVNNGYGYILKDWIAHFEQWHSVVIGYIFFFIIIIGCIKSLFSNKNRVFSILFICFFTLLALDTSPFSFVNTLLHSNALFHQIFRNPFTKFGNILLLFEAVLFVRGCQAIFSTLSSLAPVHNAIMQKTALVSLFIALFFVYSLPSWRGNLLYSQLFITYPKDYEQLFSYFKKQASGRIANFPQYAIDGWSTYSWGYYGSGFLWYGVEQPILDRAFDVWNPKNEQYYWEISHAIYSRDSSLLENVLDKYDIPWILIDKSIIGSYSPHALYVDELTHLLQESSRISLQNTFGNILLYKVAPLHQTKSFIRFHSLIAQNGSKTPWYWEDKTFQLKGPYTTDLSINASDNQGLFLFQGLFTNRNVNERDFSIDEMGEYLRVSSSIKSNLEGVLHIPTNQQPLENIDAVSLQTQKTSDLVVIANSQQISTSAAQFGANIPLQKLDSLAVLVPKIGGLYSYKLDNNYSLISSPSKNCNTLNEGYISKEIVEYPSESAIRLTSIHSNNCLEIPLPQLSQNKAYILAVKSKHVQGKPLSIRITNNSSRRTELETYLSDSKDEQTSYFILPQREPHGLGYTILFDNVSLLQNQKTINDFIDAHVFQFPYRFLANMYYGQDASTIIDEQNNVPLDNLEVIHPNPSQYLVLSHSLRSSSILELTQTFNKGWYAYPIAVESGNPLMASLKTNLPYLFSKPLTHIELNDWSNGWILPEVSQANAISIIYIPQILEYLGIGIAFCYGAWLMFFHQRRR